MYYEKWQHLDPTGSQFIKYDQLSDFIDRLEPPLRIAKPNYFVIVAMDLPICNHERIHCVDLLDGLTKYYLGTMSTNKIDEESDVPISIKKDRPQDYHPLTTTLRRQREQYLSRLVLTKFRENAKRRAFYKSEMESLIILKRTD